jgi:hypothetical protein
MENNKISFGRFAGSLLIFTLVIALGVGLIRNSNTNTPPSSKQTTVKLPELPDVVFPATIKTESVAKTAFPTGKKEPANLVTADGVYPTNTPFAMVAEAHVKGFLNDFMGRYSDKKDIVTSGGVSAESSATFSHGKKLFSYLYSDYTDEGGAHGNIAFSSETLDMNGKKYALADLFLPKTNYLNIISEKAIVYFVKDPNTNFDPKDLTFGKGLDPKLENFATFFVSGNKIIFQFQNYQIGPYSEGPQRFEISVTDKELKGIIKSELFQ